MRVTARVFELDSLTLAILKQRERELHNKENDDLAERFVEVLSSPQKDDDYDLIIFFREMIKMLN